MEERKEQWELTETSIIVDALNIEPQQNKILYNQQILNTSTFFGFGFLFF